MYFGKVTLLLVIAACVSTNAVAIKRKTVKTKIKKTNLPNIAAPKCGCQNPILDIISTGMGPAIEPLLGALGALDIGVPGCQRPVIEPLGALAPIPVAYPGYRTPIVEPAVSFAPIEIAFSARQAPVIDIPNYRYADPIELNSLGCLFPSIEIPSFGLLPPPMTLPSLEYFNAVDLPCGCPGPLCGCRAPAVKLPACPLGPAPIEIPNCGCMPNIPAYSYGGISSIIELPSYSSAVSIIPACGCQGPCSCSGIPAPPCGCQGSCSCSGIPVPPCGCKGPCSCPEYQILSCGCQGSCSCPGIPVSPCGCKGPCGCGVPVPCGCQGPCSCPGIKATGGLLPAIEVPSCGCGCGLPGCNCGQYLRQVTLQPPYL